MVIGGGPIGCELAQSFARFGSRGHRLVQEGHVLPREDADAAGIVQQAMIADGVHFEFGMKVVEARRDGAERIVVFERGRPAPRGGGGRDPDRRRPRRPTSRGWGWRPPGSRYGKRGVEVDDNLRTSNKNVFACGDVASRFQFTHIADAQARIVIQNALFFGRAKASALTIPWCTYTTPEIAHVGLYEKDAQREGASRSTP